MIFIDLPKGQGWFRGLEFNFTAAIPYPEHAGKSNFFMHGRARSTGVKILPGKKKGAEKMTQPNHQPEQTGLRVRSGTRAGEWRKESEVSWFSPKFSNYLSCEQSESDYIARWICWDESGSHRYVEGKQDIEDYLKGK